MGFEGGGTDIKNQGNIALKGLASHAGKLLTLAVTHMQINGHRPGFTQ